MQLVEVQADFLLAICMPLSELCKNTKKKFEIIRKECKENIYIVFILSIKTC